MTSQDIDDFIAGYVTCALWSSNDDSDTPLDHNYTPEDIAPEAQATMEADCEKFVSENLLRLEEWDASQAGHDFWLTRNGHGAGFWDRDDSHGRPMACRDALSDAARAFGEVDLYVGDDGRIYQS